MLENLNRILSLFSLTEPELSAVEIADRLGRPKSSVYRMLRDVEAAGFLDRDAASNRYRLGIKLAGLGEIAQRSTSLQRVAYPQLQRLSQETEETATLVVLAGREGITVDVVESVQPVMVPGLLGGHLPLHATAGGKVLAASLPPAERRARIRAPLRRCTPATVVDVDAVLAELDVVRARGYSTTRGEWVDQIYAAAAPIYNHAGAVVGAVTVGGPRSRITDARLGELAAAAVACAARVSAASGFAGPAAVAPAVAPAEPAPGVGARREAPVAPRRASARPVAHATPARAAPPTATARGRAPASKP